MIVSAAEIPDEFRRIFDSKPVEQIKPISLSTENLILESDTKPNDSDSMIGKSVHIWFDGVIKQSEKRASDLLELGQTYRVSIVKE